MHGKEACHGVCVWQTSHTTLPEFRPSFHPLCLLGSLSMLLQLPSLWACLGLWRGCVWPSHLTPPSGACWSSKHTHWNVLPWIGSAGGRKLHFSRWTLSGWCSSAWLHCRELHGCSHSTLLAYQLWRKQQSPAFQPLMWRKWVQDFVPISSGIILNKTDFFSPSLQENCTKHHDKEWGSYDLWPSV